jgi:rhodanese-related sulfurtransferase
MGATIVAVTIMARLVRQAEFLAPLRQVASRSALVGKAIECPHCLSFWFGLAFSLLWAGLGRLDSLQTGALVFLSWRLSYYFNRALDKRQTPAPSIAKAPCPACGKAYQRDFLSRQSIFFCSYVCWFGYLKKTLPRNSTAQPLFDQNGAFIRQEIYPMSYANATPEQAHQFLQADADYIYVDVRSVDEFANGHPEGAYNVPVMHRQAAGMIPNADFLTVMQAHFAPDSKLLIGCQSGARSLRAAEALIGAGFTSVTNVQGGFGGARNPMGQMVQPGWAESDLPVSAQAAEGRAYADLGNRTTPR